LGAEDPACGRRLEVGGTLQAAEPSSVYRQGNLPVIPKMEATVRTGFASLLLSVNSARCPGYFLAL
jgi:hypothetical protein